MHIPFDQGVFPLVYVHMWNGAVQDQFTMVLFEIAKRWKQQLPINRELVT